MDELDEQLQQLVEMFPTTVRVELEHCLHNAEGDVEKAVQIVLYRQETNTAITEDKKVNCPLIFTLYKMRPVHYA